jgi:tetratricopeptide (TPR) repeat protein
VIANTDSNSRYCLTCDYPLAGLAEQRCPECGTAFDPNNPDTYRPYPVSLIARSRNKTAGTIATFMVIGVFMYLALRVPGVFSAQWMGYVPHAIVVLAALAFFDAKRVQRQLAKSEELTSRAAWDELIKLNERRLRSWGLVALLQRWVLVRGGWESAFAHTLYYIGHIDRALTFANLALRRAGRRSRYRRGALEIRSIIFAAQCRYDEARNDLAELRGMEGGRAMALAREAMLEIYFGRFDEGLAMAREAMKDPSPHANTAREHAVIALVLRGEDEAALALLREPVSDLFGLLDPRTARQLLATAQGRARLEVIRRNYADIANPARCHAIAGIHLDRGELELATAALNEAAPQVQDGRAHPWVRHTHLGLRAGIAAARGRADEAEHCLAQMWALSRTAPSDALRHASLFYAGQASLLISRFDEALDHFQAALPLALHPIYEHRMAYWIARAARAAGQKELAAQHTARLIADGFDTVMRREAMAWMKADQENQDAINSPPS